MNLQNIVRYLLHHRAVVLVLLALYVAVGITAFYRLPVEAYPDVTNVQVQVITQFPGHAAEEVERLISIPVENEMNGIPGRTSMRSISLFGLSVVTLVFDDQVAGVFARAQAFERMQGINFPAGAQASLSPDSTPIGEIYRYTLRAPKNFPLVELKALEDWVVERQFRTVPGVVDVAGFGGPTKQYQVWIEPLKLKSYGISLQQIFAALAGGNQNAGGAYIEHGSEMYIVRGLGLMRNIQDIEMTAVGAKNGTPILIRDMGKVVVGSQIRLGRVGLTTNGNGRFHDDDDVVQGIVLLRKGENALAVLQRVKAKVKEINAGLLPPGVRLVPHYDRTELIDRTLHTVRKNMVEGISLVLLVLILFLGLGDYRAALVVAIVVPLSLLGAFLLLDLRGIPANLISMGAIDFGIIVDSAVVITEHLLQSLDESARAGRPSLLFKAIAQAVADTGRPVLFSKLILLTAFLPLFTMQRVEGKIFRPMAYTLSFALLGGTLIAIIVVPVLLSFVLKSRTAQGESRLLQFLRPRYETALRVALDRPRLVLAIALILLVAAGITTRFTGSEFLPKLDEGALWIRMSMPGNIAPSEAAKLTARARSLIAGFPEAKTIVSQLGRPDDGTDVNGFDTSEFYVELLPRDRWTTANSRDALVAAINQKLSSLPGLDFNFSQVIEDNVNEAVSGIKGELGIKIFGENPDTLQSLALQAAALLHTVPGAEDIVTEKLSGQPQIQISVNRLAVARSGRSVADVQSVIETAMGGSVATRILEGERAFDLVIKLAPDALTGLEAIRQIPIPGAGGDKLTLGELANVEVKPGFARIFREDNQRRIAVKFSARGVDLGTIVAQARKLVEEKIQAPPGYRFEWTGSFENQQRAMRRLMVVVPLTLMAVFLLLFFAFDSLRLAMLVLLNVPFAAVGGIFALPCAGLHFSVSAMVGFIALFGVAIQNGVLLIDRIRELKGEGRSSLAAIQGGASSRLRQVAMTSVMAAVGLLPAALSHGVGAETSRPFAVVIIGGLVTATGLTLFVLPVLYETFSAKDPLSAE